MASHSATELRINSNGTCSIPMSDEKRTPIRTILQSVLEIAVLSSSILVLMAVLFLPVFFFYQATAFLQLQNNSSVNVSENYSECLRYEEGLCYRELKNYLNSCSNETHTNKEIFVASKNETAILSAVSVLKETNASELCRMEILSFLCLHLYGLCNDAGIKIHPTVNQCHDIQTRTCPTEWNIIYAAGIYLQRCQNVSDDVGASCLSRNRTQPLEKNCSKNFVFDEESQICAPSCQHWSLYGEKTTITLQVIIVASYSLGVLFSMTALAVSIKRHKAMFQIPSIFLVYAAIDFLIIDFIIALGSSNSNLFCNTQSRFRTTTSLFCNISGMVFTYCLPQTALWWLFHSVFFFWGTWFPFNFEKHKAKGNLKKIHIFLILSGILLPVYSIIFTVVDNAISPTRIVNINYSSHSLGFAHVGIPARLCIPGSYNSFFYGIVVPIEVSLAASGVLILLVIYHLYKNKKLTGAAEIKLMLILLHFIIVDASIILEFSLSLRRFGDLHDTLQNYFDCESQGFNVTPCPREYESLTNPILLAISNFIIPFSTIFVLIYTINLRESKTFCRKIIHPKLSDHMSNS